MAEYTDRDVQALANVITDAYLKGIRAGSATLARTILDAGWRREPAEQLPVDKHTETPLLPCPEGFHWIGQRWDSCEHCGLPATEHAGMAMLAGTDPFDGARWVLDPWKPGEVGYVADPSERLRVVRASKESAMDAGDFVALQPLRDLEKAIMAERNAGGHGEASPPGPCGHDGCNHRRGHSGRHSWQEGDRG